MSNTESITKWCNDNKLIEVKDSSIRKQVFAKQFCSKNAIYELQVDYPATDKQKWYVRIIPVEDGVEQSKVYAYKNKEVNEVLDFLNLSLTPMLNHPDADGLPKRPQRDEVRGVIDWCRCYGFINLHLEHAYFGFYTITETVRKQEKKSAVEVKVYYPREGLKRWKLVLKKKKGKTRIFEAPKLDEAGFLSILESVVEPYIHDGQIEQYFAKTE